MKNVFALIDLHASPELGVLTEKRPVASTTVLGRYAFIDFALSNLTNSGIDDIGILIKDHFRSVVKHLTNNNTYLKNSKTGYFNLMLNEDGLKNPFFNTDINNIRANDYFLYDQSSKYVIVIPVGFITRIDYSKVIDEHITSGKGVSCIYAPVKNAGVDFLGLNKYTINALGNIQKVEEITSKDDEVYLGLKTFIFNKEVLKDFLNKTRSLSKAFSITDMMTFIQKYGDATIHAIKSEAPVRYVNSLEKYYNVSMELKELLGHDSCHFFDNEWKIYTRTHDTRPVLYGQKAVVRDSLIANGCTVYGTVDNSILARNVIVEEGASVRNSIIFTDCIIKSGVHLDGVIADKLCRFENKVEVKSGDGSIIYVPQGEIL